MNRGAGSEHRLRRRRDREGKSNPAGLLVGCRLLVDVRDLLAPYLPGAVLSDILFLVAEAKSPSRLSGGIHYRVVQYPETSPAPAGYLFTIGTTIY